MAPAGAAWALLSEEEALQLLLSLAFYFREQQRDSGWHHHVGVGEHELTIAVDPGIGDSS